MGRVKPTSMHVIRKLAADNPFFTVKDAQRLVGKEYAYLVLNILTKRGEIHRLAKGYYSKFDDPSLLVYYFRPAYIGLFDAMSYLNLWEQESATMIITTRRVRRGTRTVFGNNVIVKRIDPKHFFGFEFLETEGYSIPVSTVEKTLIDLIYFRYWRSEYLNNFRGRADRDILEEYLSGYKGAFRRYVLSVVKL